MLLSSIAYTVGAQITATSTPTSRRLDGLGRPSGLRLQHLNVSRIIRRRLGAVQAHSQSFSLPVRHYEDEKTLGSPGEEQ